MIKRDYVNVGSAGRPQYIHFHRAGTGPALVMLHASPMSSAALLPFIEVAAQFVTVIAPDTPGYGWSDPLVESTGNLEGYITALNTFVERLGLDGFGLYGSATGAQIAIEYSKAYAGKVSYLILDNAAHFTDEERERIVSGYFPDLTPDQMGSHLIKTWSAARNQGLFFPLLDELWEQVLNYPLGERLSKLQCSVDVNMIETDPLTGVGRRSLNTQRFLRPGNDRM